MKTIRYFYERQGILYMIAYYLCRVGVLNKEIVNGCSFITKKFYSYFETISKDQYYDELEEQLNFIVAGIGKEYNLRKPLTFNEKIQWIKLNDTTLEKTRLTDKYEVRNWVASVIGEKYLIPLVGGPWDRGKDIDFDSLPNSFVLKANHGSGMNLVVKDKKNLDLKKVRKITDCWMNTLYGWKGMEVQYFGIKRKIIAEKYIEQNDGDLVDYKVHCFDGEPKIIQVIGDRNLKKHTAYEAFFDTEWNRNDYMYHTYEQYDNSPECPECLDELLEVARKLSQGFKYVRVDLYILEGEIKFGEMTFTPAGGCGKWVCESNNKIVGDFIAL